MPPDLPQWSVVLADDEPLPRRRLRRLLQAAPNLKIVEECSDGTTALAAIRQHQPDLLFLDVQMPGMNGFDVLRSLGSERLPVVIFVTAFDEFALAAFEAQAVDYLLKPFGEERVQQALERAFAINNRELYDYLVTALAGGHEIRTTSLPVRDARELLYATHVLDVGAADWKNTGLRFEVRETGRRVKTDYFTGMDEFIIKVVEGAPANAA